MVSGAGAFQPLGGQRGVGVEWLRPVSGFGVDMASLLTMAASPAAKSFEGSEPAAASRCLPSRGAEQRRPRRQSPSRRSRQGDFLECVCVRDATQKPSEEALTGDGVSTAVATSGYRGSVIIARATSPTSGHTIV